MKGKTIIELTDVRTGEVERYEDTNMFTNALDSLFNRAPWWFNDAALADLDTSGFTNYPMAPIVGNALGGLLLFPQTIEEDASNIFAPANNKPTGISSFDGYAGEDSRRGSYNEIESGPITNGHKFVFDFSTSQANGLISCIGLTSARGGAGYWDGGENLINAKSTNNKWPSGAAHNIPTLNYICAIGGNDDGLYFTSGTSTVEVYKLATPRAKFSLHGDPINPEKIGTITSNGTKAIGEDGKLWVIRNSGNSSGNANLTIDKYDLKTWEKTTQTMTVAAQLKASENNRNTAISNGKLYLQGYDGTSMFIINLSNIADVTKVENAIPTGITGRNAGCVAFNGGAIGRHFLIEADGTPHAGFDLVCLPLGADGVWLINIAYDWTSTQMRVGSCAITPYLATINNLQTAINKTANQTAKVTYIVTEN